MKTFDLSLRKMTPELQVRLERSLPPFDGISIHNAAGISLSDLGELLLLTVAYLKPRYPDIRSFHDWHEHDGFIVEPTLDSWPRLTAATSTDRSLFDSRHGDQYVRVAIYPSNFDWLLRYNVDAEDEADYGTAWCDFDLTIALNTECSNLIGDLLEKFAPALVKSVSRPRFMSNYGG